MDRSLNLMDDRLKSRKFFRNTIIVVFILWLASIFLVRHFVMAGLRRTEIESGIEGYIRIEFVVLFVFFILLFNMAFNFFDKKYFLYRFNYEQKFLIKVISTFIFAIIIITAISGIFSAVYDNYQFYPNVMRHQFIGFLVTPLILFIIYFMDLTKISQRMELENEKLLSQNLSAQLQLLKQQIKPHFLFNSLNHLISLVRANDCHTEEFVIHLSELYRYILQTDLKDKIPLREELKIISHYFFMLKSRFEENINFTVKINEDIYSSYIPPFTLQILIENSVKHNIISKAKPLYVRIFSDNNKLIIENNLQGKKNTEDSHNVGLANLNQRYLLICGKPIEVNKTDKCFQIILPVIS